jgi:hypothetical protein
LCCATLILRLDELSADSQFALQEKEFSDSLRCVAQKLQRSYRLHAQWKPANAKFDTTNTGTTAHFANGSAVLKMEER